MRAEEKDRIVICKSCRRPEYWGQMRWLNGKCTCRDCYRSEWESMRGEQYRWNDLDGNRPTMQDYNKQEEEYKNGIIRNGQRIQ